LAKVIQRAVKPSACRVVVAEPVVPWVPPPGLGVPAALSYTMTTSRGFSLAPIQVIPVRVRSTATVSR
jgi:hypothetical protein